METTVVKEQAQIGGCMAGFFNIFDRPHLLSPKRFALPRRLSLKTAESEPPVKQQSVYPTPELRSPDENLPVMEFKQGSSWRFSKEAPRLSLDSRAVVDAKGSLKPRQIRRDRHSTEDGSGSPSVIARLMGLEALPSTDSQQPLQRSASESRVSREFRFVDTFNFQNPSSIAGGEDPAEFHIRSGRAQPARAPPAPQRRVVRRKSFFDSAEPKQLGFDAPTTDLETLKQLLEALRLKGLLHSSTNRNQSPIKPHFSIRSGTGTRASRSPMRSRSTSENSVNRRPTLKERQQRSYAPLPCWRRPEPVKTWNRGGSIEEECSTLGEQEMWKVDEYNRQGKTLLERCDKLLHSIAEMAAAVESQPSPVSVLLYHEEEESSPSPVMKRSLDFFTPPESEEDESSSDSEYVYISVILRASDCLPQESDIFSLLEKQQYLKGAAAQERRLIFDAVQEIVGRIRRLPPWRMVGEADKMQVIWSEFQKIRMKRSTEEKDLVGYVCGVLGRDLSEDRWRDCQVELSEAVLDIERLVFKDLIAETIRHMAALKSSDSLRRRLLF